MNVTKTTVQSTAKALSGLTPMTNTVHRAPSLKDTLQNAPPINDALQPDIFSRLDAEVIERTRVANTQLDMRLHLQENIIRKHRHEAERCLLTEKSRVVDDLNRITSRMPAMARIQDFDDKFFTRRSTTDPSHLRHKKNYESEKNEGPICERCYIHHMPLKKKFYRKVTPDPILPAEDSSPHQILSESPAKDVFPHGSLPITEDTLLQNNDALRSAVSGRRQYIPGSEDVYRFLDRDTLGREKDLNQIQTPRLMPNEIWKGLVKNVCDQLVGRDLKPCGKRTRELSRGDTRASQSGKGNKERSRSFLTLSRASSKLSKRSDTASSMRHGKLKSGTRSLSRSDTSAGKATLKSAGRGTGTDGDVG
ncbi:unnamed protein product [Lymnaea stagnalis]|uniref:Uncharacterized protein n=1 Tax=Lymnaea stagnalis TaxID=6523 RepID=A0AAV2I2H9_LYMST